MHAQEIPSWQRELGLDLDSDGEEAVDDLPSEVKVQLEVMDTPLGQQADADKGQWLTGLTSSPAKM